MMPTRIKAQKKTKGDIKEPLVFIGKVSICIEKIFSKQLVLFFYLTTFLLSDNICWQIENALQTMKTPSFQS